jgi:ketosteroid isomerase-like protein
MATPGEPPPEETPLEETPPNVALVQRFYWSFGTRDGDAMAACYAPEVHFRDPVFGDLFGAEAGAMWRMLTGRAEDLEVYLHEHEADDERGTAHWIAKYTYSQTGRHVTNDIHAQFRFADGLIVEHFDDFNLYKWERQALGPVGTLFGWTPMLKGAVRRRARAALDEYQSSEG